MLETVRSEPFAIHLKGSLPSAVPLPVAEIVSPDIESPEPRLSPWRVEPTPEYTSLDVPTVGIVVEPFKLEELVTVIVPTICRVELGMIVPIPMLPVLLEILKYMLEELATVNRPYDVDVPTATPPWRIPPPPSDSE